MSYGLRLTANYSDSYYMSATNDPYLRADSYTKTDALIWLGSSDESWKVSLLGKNLSDERVPFFANSTPLVDEAYFSSVQVGREYYLEFSYRM
jgi:outer membrane receptor protein involved in Fe transport